MVPIRLVGLLLVVGLWTTAAGAGVVEDIRDLCAEEWPGDYQMQEYCIGQQTRNARAYAELLERYPQGTEERNILGRCLGEWLDDRDRADYVMVVYCSTNQIEAYRRLNP